jgi:hypothetical protein
MSTSDWLGIEHRNEWNAWGGWFSGSYASFGVEEMGHGVCWPTRREKSSTQHNHTAAGSTEKIFDGNRTVGYSLSIDIEYFTRHFFINQINIWPNGPMARRLTTIIPQSRDSRL